MGHYRLSLRVKNMTILLFVLDVTKSLFGKHAQIYSNALLLLLFSIPCHVFMQLQGLPLTPRRLSVKVRRKNNKISHAPVFIYFISAVQDNLSLGISSK